MHRSNFLHSSWLVMKSFVFSDNKDWLYLCVPKIACKGGAPPTHLLYSGLATLSVMTAPGKATNAHSNIAHVIHLYTGKTIYPTTTNKPPTDHSTTGLHMPKFNCLFLMQLSQSRNLQTQRVLIQSK
jgi:hypothetical protein